MSAPILAVGQGSTSLWYLTRATGIVALLLLTATVVLGILASVGWTTERWPRFMSQDIHRNLSLFCLVLIVVHILTTVVDGYVPIGFLDAVFPFRTAYRPLWVGLGALAFDMLLAVLITSGLRRHVGYRAWRAVHWLSYACWPVALLHALGTGTDSHLSLIALTYAVCVGAVLAALAWRLATWRTLPLARRAGAGIAAAAVTVGIGVFASLGPFRPGWSQRAGTSAALLRQISAAQAGTAQAGGSAPSPAGAPSSTSSGTAPQSTAPPSTASPSGGIPSVPFTSQISGSVSTSSPDASGQVAVTISTHIEVPPGTPLQVVLTGMPVGDGVEMSSSHVSFGPDAGTVTRLSGTHLIAVVYGEGREIQLDVQLELDTAANTATGTVTAGYTGA